VRISLAIVVLTACAGPRTSTKITLVHPGATGARITQVDADDHDTLLFPVYGDGMNGRREPDGVTTFVSFGEGLHQINVSDGSDFATCIVPIKAGFTTEVRVLLHQTRTYPDEDLDAQTDVDRTIIWGPRGY
jgi:hypothetical protein